MGGERCYGLGFWKLGGGGVEDLGCYFIEKRRIGTRKERRGRVCVREREREKKAVGERGDDALDI